MIKLNWGWGIAIFLGVYVAGIMALVIGSMRQTIDLVAPNYYEMEMNHDQKVEMIRNASAAGSELSLAVKEGKLILTFGENAIPENGTLKLYRPSDASLDRMLDLQTIQTQQFPVTELRSGLWNVQVTWEKAGKKFYAEQSLTL